MTQDYLVPDKPLDFKRNAGIFIYSYPGFTIRFDRIDEAHQSVAAEVTIVGSMPDANGLLLQSRFSLTSSMGVPSLKKQMLEILPQLPWQQIARYTFSRTLKDWREGEPIEKVDAIEPQTDKLDYRVWPIIVEGKPNVWHGDSGTLKTFLSELSLFMVTMPEPKHCGLNAEPGAAALLDWEDDKYEFEYRIAALSRGMLYDGVKPAQLYYRRMTRSLVEDIERLQAMVLELGIEYLVIDSAGPAVGGDPLDTKAVIQYFAALRTLQFKRTREDKPRPCTTLTLAHEPKNATVKTAYGSGFWKFEARSMWEVRRNEERNTPKVNIGMYHRKANKGMLRDSLAFTFHFASDSPLVVNVTSFNIEHDTDLSGGLSIREQITAILKDGPKTEKELQELLPNVEKSSLHAKLWAKGGFQRLEGLRFGLASDRVEG